MEPAAFFWTLRGGRWTAEHRGVAYDSYRAQARGGSPSTFCVLHRLPKTATFAVARYSEDVCLELAKLWIHRMTFLYELWFRTGLAKPVLYTSGLLSSYKVPAELESLFAVPGHAQARAREILRLAPKVR